MIEIAVTVLSGSVGAGIMAIVLAALQRRWKKKDGKDAAIASLVNAQKVLMIDRVRYLGSRYIKQAEISLEDKENLHDMYAAYKTLGGNGHLETIMHEVDRLPVKQ